MSDEELKRLLCSAFPAPHSQSQPQDLWLSLQHRMQEPAPWSRVDLLVAVAVAIGTAITLLAVPKAVLLLSCL